MFQDAPAALSSLPLNAALWGTNLLVVMRAQGWLAPTLSWTTIGWVVAYTAVWRVVMDFIEWATYQVIDQVTGWQTRLGHMVTKLLKS